MSNFVNVMSDEHSPFVSSVYGYQIVQTPNMERLANRGTVFKKQRVVAREDIAYGGWSE